MTKIDRKIVKYAVQKPEQKAASEKPAEPKASAQSSEPEMVRDKNGRTAKVIRMTEIWMLTPDDVPIDILP